MRHALARPRGRWARARSRRRSAASSSRRRARARARSAPASTARQRLVEGDVPLAHAFSIVTIGTPAMPSRLQRPLARARRAEHGADVDASIASATPASSSASKTASRPVAGAQLGLLAEQRRAHPEHRDVAPRAHGSTSPLTARRSRSRRDRRGRGPARRDPVTRSQCHVGPVHVGEDPRAVVDVDVGRARTAGFARRPGRAAPWPRTRSPRDRTGALGGGRDTPGSRSSRSGSGSRTRRSGRPRGAAAGSSVRSTTGRGSGTPRLHRRARRGRHGHPPLPSPPARSRSARPPITNRSYGLQGRVNVAACGRSPSWLLCCGDR